MLQFDLQFFEELTVARVKTVKFISGAFFWPTGQLVLEMCSISIFVYCIFLSCIFVYCIVSCTHVRFSTSIVPQLH